MMVGKIQYQFFLYVNFTYVYLLVIPDQYEENPRYHSSCHICF